MAKIIAKTARRQLGGRHAAIWRIFAEVDKPTIEDELNIDGGKHVLAVFLN